MRLRRYSFWIFSSTALAVEKALSFSFFLLSRDAGLKTSGAESVFFCFRGDVSR